MYRKRLKTLKIGLKNAFSELAGCGRSPHRKPNVFLRAKPAAKTTAVLSRLVAVELYVPILFAKLKVVFV
jgi:hypothetical protein